MEVNQISFYVSPQVEIIKGKCNHSFPLHLHKGCCIGILKKGQVKLCWKNQQLTVSSPAIYIIPTFTPHTMMAIEEQLYEYVTIYVPSLFNEIYTVQQWLCQKEEMVQLFMQWISTYEVDKRAESFDELRILIDQVFVIENSSIKQEEHDVILKAIEYIEKNREHKFQIENIADAVHMSKYHFIRLFKKHTGITPYQYLLLEKMRVVREELIKEKEESSIAYDLGFTDQSHLCNSFKKQMGITPKAFKQNQFN